MGIKDYPICSVCGFQDKRVRKIDGKYFCTLCAPPKGGPITTAALSEYILSYVGCEVSETVLLEWAERAKRLEQVTVTVNPVPTDFTPEQERAIKRIFMEILKDVLIEV